MSEFDVLDLAARAMDAQRSVLDVAARNVAAAQASTPGHAYPRLVARLVDDDDGLRYDGAAAAPGSSDALTEMIGVLDAQRAYEQNASLFDVGKRLAERTLAVGGP